MRGRENHRADTLSMPDDPFDDSWGWGEAAAIKIFVFLRLPTSWNRLFAPRFPLCRSIEFCQQPYLLREFDRSRFRFSPSDSGPEV